MNNVNGAMNGAMGSLNSKALLNALLDLQSLQAHKQDVLNRETELIQIIVTQSAFTNINQNTMAELLAARAAIG